MGRGGGVGGLHTAMNPETHTNQNISTINGKHRRTKTKKHRGTAQFREDGSFSRPVHNISISSVLPDSREHDRSFHLSLNAPANTRKAKLNSRTTGGYQSSKIKNVEYIQDSNPTHKDQIYQP